jgi:2-dehydro-3-deoxyphosphogluconate aldolase/(4S)-4-hydroxy-2-oxoglutarate aldolase
VTADPAPTDPLARLRAAAVVAVLRADTADQAVDAARALAEGGVRAIELTFTTPGVAGALRRVRDELPAGVVVGAGTIRDRDQLDAAVAAGAEFLVTPHLDPALLEAMLATGLAVLPGVLTPSEVAGALGAGATAVKLFPASTVGPKHLKALLGPFPGLAIVPTGGIAAGDVRTWLDAGAIAVGAGSELCPAAAIRTGDAGALTAAARRYLAEAGV